MIYVGIDVAKQGHFASLISSDGEILVGPFQFSNNGDGFQYLVSAFEPFDDEEIIIGLESTVHCNALGHCAGKLVRIIWKMMTDNVEFNLD